MHFMRAIVTRGGSAVKLIRLLLCSIAALSAHSAIAQNDARALNRSSHDIKGTLVNFYAPAAVNAAFELEMRGNEGRMNGADAAFVVLKNAVKRLEADLVSFVNQPMIQHDGE